MTEIQNEIIETTDAVSEELSRDADTPAKGGKQKKAKAPLICGVLSAVLGGITLLSPVAILAVGLIGSVVDILINDMILADPGYLFFKLPRGVRSISHAHPIADVSMLLAGACFAVLAVVALFLASRSRRRDTHRMHIGGKVGSILALGGLFGTSLTVILQLVGTVLTFLLSAISLLIGVL